MRRYTWKFAMVGILLISMAEPQGAQMHWREPMMGGPYYNPATEVTLKGSVEAVNQAPLMLMHPNRNNMRVTLKTEKETFEVFVGPSWFLEEHKMAFAKGDQIEVTGSRAMTGMRGEVLLAREIKKGEQTLTLRNMQGVPMWRGGRMQCFPT